MSDVTTRRVRSIALGTVLGLVLGIALVANASRRRLDPSPGRIDDAASRATSTTSPTRRRSSALEEGFFEDALGNDHARDVHLQRRADDGHRAALRLARRRRTSGPNPTVSAFQQSDGAVQVISGVASGGAYLVVKPDIKKPKDLEGKTIATPQLGNTQDVALRSYLKKKGFETDTAGGGDVSILPAGQRDHAPGLPGRPDPGRVGAGAVGDPPRRRGRRQGARRRARPVAERRVRDDAT